MVPEILVKTVPVTVSPFFWEVLKVPVLVSNFESKITTSHFCSRKQNREIEKEKESKEIEKELKMEIKGREKERKVKRERERDRRKERKAMFNDR